MGLFRNEHTGRQCNRVPNFFVEGSQVLGCPDEKTQDFLCDTVNQVSLDCCCEIKANVTVSNLNRTSFSLLYRVLPVCLCSSFF